MVANKPKCRHCAVALAQVPGFPDKWVHAHNQERQCRSMVNRALLDSFAQPRPDK